MFKSHLVSFHYTVLKQGFAKTNFHMTSLSRHITLTWEKRSNWRVRVDSVCAWFIPLNPMRRLFTKVNFTKFHFSFISQEGQKLVMRRKWNRLGKRKWIGRSLLSKDKYPAYKAKSAKEVCVSSFQKGVLNGLYSQRCKQYTNACLITM